MRQAQRKHDKQMVPRGMVPRGFSTGYHLTRKTETKLSNRMVQQNFAMRLFYTFQPIKFETFLRFCQWKRPVVAKASVSEARGVRCLSPCQSVASNGVSKYNERSQ